MRNIEEFDGAGSKSVARRFNFTQKRLDAVPLPTNGQRSYVYDTVVRGLALAVSPAGKRVFILYRKVQGRPERVTIGDYRDLSIGYARNKAEELNGAIARGENPAADKRQVRAEMTLGELCDRYLESLKDAGCRSHGKVKNFFDNHLHGWRLRKISEIRKSDVVALHAKIGRTQGHTVANRVMQSLRSTFSRAINDWGWTGENPAAGIKAFRETKRKRFLEGPELAKLFQALRDESNETIRDYILISLLTGARRGNVQAMRWSELHLARDVWSIPETKNGESQDVYLPSPAKKILLTREKKASGSPWVFPGAGRTGHLVEPKGAWRRILKRADLQDVRLHDLRRTLGSWQAAGGTSLLVIGKTLGHKSAGATAVYARLNLDPVRQSVDLATNAMLLAGRKSPKLLEGRKL